MPKHPKLSNQIGLDSFPKAEPVTARALVYGSPNCLQTTSASRLSQDRSQTMPQVFLKNTSIRPSLALDPPASRTGTGCVSETGQKLSYFKTFELFDISWANTNAFINFNEIMSVYSLSSNNNNNNNNKLWVLKVSMCAHT